MASFLEWQLDHSSDLLQNCDLPPPLKLFSPLHEDHNTSRHPKYKWDGELVRNNSAPPDTSLRRALQLSQSRAREAERKVAAAETEREHMGALLLHESLRLSAHRQWVNLLELEVATLNNNNKRRRPNGDGDDDAALAWCFTLALCLGIGFVLGRCMF